MPLDSQKQISATRRSDVARHGLLYGDTESISLDEAQGASRGTAVLSEVIIVPSVAADARATSTAGQWFDQSRPLILDSQRERQRQ